jgi:hypothetical protein
MSRRVNDRALRRLLLTLSEARPDDVAAILSGLDDGQRSTAESMLQQISGRRPEAAVASAEPPAAAPPRGEWEIEGISPWLAARLANGSASAGGAGELHSPFSLTPDALKALRGAAEAIRSPRPEALQRPPSKARRSLLDQVQAAFVRGRR